MLTAFFSWWYGEGWKRQVSRVSNRMAGLLDTFSFDLLIRTWFSPFRQISAGAVQGPIGVQIQIIIDKIVSRFIGAMIRAVMLFVGVLAIIVVGVLCIIQLVVWPLLPFGPIVGVVLMMTGWVPSL